TIRQSRGALYGTAWAVVGTVLPVVACCVGSPLLLAVSWAPARSPRRVVQPPVAEVAVQPIPTVTDFGEATTISAAELRRIRSLWELAARLPPTPAPDDLRGLYAPN